jgi:hypothetical protein
MPRNTAEKYKPRKLSSKTGSADWRRYVHNYWVFELHPLFSILTTSKLKLAFRILRWQTKPPKPSNSVLHSK